MDKKWCIETFNRLRGGSYDVHIFLKNVEKYLATNKKRLVKSDGALPACWDRELCYYTKVLTKASRCRNGEKLSVDDLSVKA